MSYCPNCSYLLVLLERRRKYKCAKCGKLFSQKEIDTKEFRELNKKQRKEDRLEHRREQIRVSSFRIRQRLKKERESKPKESSEEHRERVKVKSQEYRNRLGRQQKKEQNEKRQARRKADIEGTRLQSRIGYWRQQQKALALVQYENECDKACSHQIQFILPTSLHSDLLQNA